ncbi:DUF1579 family protein [Bremerella sp. T1]|uniref:DUF1579 family protein n=1 Tax=Bremerella sp. TYQ1 TaxID=3119568 RepID=UPI001CCD6BDD|nr:DUF1579 family protein [Bremerella volcania]UBM35168.1 DUF1579 domain-containing protein [Bremerella volcania]
MKIASKLTGLFLVLVLGNFVWAEEPAAKPDTFDPAMLEEMMAKLGAPGEPHMHLQEMVGKYKTVSTWIVPGKEQESVDDGTAEFKSILGGRFVTQEFKSTYNGETMEGFGILGYDNAKQKFVGIWLDNMSTHILRTEGTLDEKTGVMTETGVCSSPVGEMNFKMVTKPTDKGFVFTLGQVADGSVVPMGKIEYIKQ